MGNWWSVLSGLWGASEPSKIVMLGLDAAGKTSILYNLKLGEIVQTIPTIGFNVETLEPVKGLTFTVWDVGGQQKIRALWKPYYTNTDGLIYVIDSSDRARLEEAKEELFSILNADEMYKVPAVIIANKQDLPNAISPSDLIDYLGLHKETGRAWHVQGSVAIKGEGLAQSMQELARMVKQYKNERRR